MASRALVEWWNARAAKIEACCSTREEAFSWGQLVWQELEMWERIGKPVGESEVDFMVRRRGFTVEQKVFLTEGLKALNLWGRVVPWVEVPVKRAVEEVEEALLSLRAIAAEGDPKVQAAMLWKADRCLQRARSQIALAEPGPFEDDDKGEEEELLSLQGGE